MLLRDQRGAAAAEYALLLAIVGGTMALASTALGGAVSNAGAIQATGADGKVYTCTANCQFNDQDICWAMWRSKEETPAPTFTPALPATNGTCPKHP